MNDANIQKYLSFVKTVELGSFSKAAEALNYSQSGISRMIGDLEREWEITLLERDRNGVRLTSDGLRMLPFARQLCEDYARLLEQVDELGNLKSGLIRIGTFSSVATHWLPKIILPKLILKRIPYEVAVLPLDKPAYRKIGLAFRSRKLLPAAAKKFLEYLDSRETE